MTAVEQKNPLLEGLQVRPRPEPCVLVIFGASGDLTQRKLMPALYALAYRHLLPERFAVVGAARSEETDDEFRERMKEAVQAHARDEFSQEVWDELASGMRYSRLEAADDRDEDRLGSLLTELDAEPLGTSGNSEFYSLRGPAERRSGRSVQEIAERRSASGWVRLIVEKPFGHDLASARALNELIAEQLAEREVFRIDHYLGKADGAEHAGAAIRGKRHLLSRSGAQQFIDSTCRSPFPRRSRSRIENQAAFYEQLAGATCATSFQNHLLAARYRRDHGDGAADRFHRADSVRNEKVKVLKSLHTPGPKSVVQGQYGCGFVEVEEAGGYREEPGVARDSPTETYAAKLDGRQPALADTPFHVHGKRLARGRGIDDRDPLKRAAASAVREAAPRAWLRPNVLLIHVQPNEGCRSICAAHSGARDDDPHGSRLSCRPRSVRLPESSRIC